LRIGVTTTPPGGYVTTDPQCAAAVGEAARILEGLGHHVDDASPAALFERDALRERGALWLVGVAWILDRHAELVGKEITADDVETSTWLAAERGRKAEPEWARLVTSVLDWRARLLEWWETNDLLLTPTTTTAAPPLGWFSTTPDDPMRGLKRGGEYAPFTSAFNATGQPAISVPVGRTADGLPLGVQIAAGIGREDHLVAVAAQIERAFPWPHMANA
jgi:amidase